MRIMDMPVACLVPPNSDYEKGLSVEVNILPTLFPGRETKT